MKIVQNRKKAKMISQPSKHVMSNDTLKVAKSAVQTSVDGTSQSRTNKSKVETAKLADSLNAPLKDVRGSQKKDQ